MESSQNSVNYEIITVLSKWPSYLAGWKTWNVNEPLNLITDWPTQSGGPNLQRKVRKDGSGGCRKGCRARQTRSRVEKSAGNFRPASSDNTDIHWNGIHWRSCCQYKRWKTGRGWSTCKYFSMLFHWLHLCSQRPVQGLPESFSRPKRQNVLKIDYQCFEQICS